MRNVAKFYHLGQGKKAGRFIGQQNVRCCRPPLGYDAISNAVNSGLYPFRVEVTCYLCFSLPFVPTHLAHRYRYALNSELLGS
jgi:hypothetical protein